MESRAITSAFRRKVAKGQDGCRSADKGIGPNSGRKRGYSD